jgi:TRAP-type C4-dicarboxylate transport system substrate-binding protein
MRVVWSLLVLLVFAPIDQGLARDFKISHQWPAETDARDRAARIFAREVEKRIPGVSIQVYPQLSLKMKAEEQFEALQAGTLDMSVYVLPYAAKKVPEFSLAVLPGYIRTCKLSAS